MISAAETPIARHGEALAGPPDGRGRMSSPHSHHDHHDHQQHAGAKSGPDADHAETADLAVFTIYREIFFYIYL